jgi:UDP-glucose 4-epimerase
MFALVTGGAGFIGSHSVEALLAAGAQVRVLDNLSSGHRHNLAGCESRLEFVEGDVRDATCVEHCMQGMTHVLHLAAQVSVPASVKTPVHSHSVNIAGFLNVLDAARRNGVQRMAYASSAAVYGVPVTLPLSETSPIAPLSPYGLEKLVNDQYAALYKNLYGFSAVGLRYFNVYGPRQDPRSPYSGVISKFAAWAMENEIFSIFGDGLQTRDFIYAGDVARVNVKALQSDMCGVINVATGNSVTLLQLAQAFEVLVAHPVEIRHGATREGDVPHSSVMPLRMRDELGIKETVPLAHGLKHLLDYLHSIQT